MTAVQNPCVFFLTTKEPRVKKKEISTKSIENVLTSGLVVRQDPAGLGYTIKMKINEVKSIAVDSNNNKVYCLSGVFS